MNIPQETTMRVAMAKLELYFPACHSLKEKRHILKKIKDRVWSGFKVSIHEVHYQDKWQRAQLGLAVVSNDAKVANSVIDKIIHSVEEIGLCDLLDSSMEIVSF